MIVIITLIISGIFFFTGNYPFEMRTVEFLIRATINIIFVGAMYLLFKSLCKPKQSQE